MSIRFLVTKAASTAIDAYTNREQRAWTERSFDWAEKQGLPGWMSEWFDIYNNEYCKEVTSARKAASWRQAVGFYNPHLKGRSRSAIWIRRVSKFRQKIDKEYEKIEPWPTANLRPANWNEWDESDPLKPFAKAAIVTLQDLRTPVRIRDSSIDAFGAVQTGRAGIRESVSAGHPSGALGNRAPEELAELHLQVLKVGRGNVKRGIKRVLSMLQEKQSVAHGKEPNRAQTK